MWGWQNQVTVCVTQTLRAGPNTEQEINSILLFFKNFQKSGEPRKPFELDKMEQSI